MACTKTRDCIQLMPSLGSIILLDIGVRKNQLQQGCAQPTPAPMKLDRRRNEAPRRLLGTSARGQLLFNGLPFGCYPGSVGFEEYLLLVFEVLVERSGRVSRLLGNAIRIGSLIAKTVEKSSCGGYQALPGLFRRTATRAQNIQPFRDGA